MTAIQSAIDYRNRELFCVPVAHGKKGCKLTGWQHERYAVEEIPTKFKADDNLLLILGIDNIADVDLDTMEAVRAARRFIPATGFRWGRDSKPCSHGLFRLDRAIPTVQYRDPTKVIDPDDPKKTTHEMVAELRCLTSDGAIGLGSIIPPGFHGESGEVVRFEAGSGAAAAIAVVNADDLSIAVARTAAAALLAKHWPPSGGGRNKFELALAGALAAGGMEQAAAVQFVLGAYQTLTDFDTTALERVRESVESTYAKHAASEAHTGFTKMCEYVPPVVATTALKWLGCASVSEVTWEEPLELDTVLRAVRPFDPGILPPLMAEYCADIQKCMLVPPEVVAASLIVGASIAIGNRAAIQPKSQDSRWLLIPNLWGAVIGEPGTNKSGAMTEALAPLFELHDELVEQSDRETADYWKAHAHYKRELSIWESRVKKIMKSDDPDRQRPEQPVPPQKPPYREIVINESTPEALHASCTDNPHGLFTFSDELSTWFLNMDRPGRESERGLWLTGWTGNKSYTHKTLSRGNVRVPNLCLSVLGSTQPGKWRNYIDSVIEGKGRDGLIQRLQLLVWPDDAPRHYVNIARNHSLIAQVKARFRQLLAIGGGQDEPIVYTWSKDAEARFEAWWNKLEAKRSASILSEAEISHFSKYQSLMPSLALIFELFDDPKEQQRLYEDEGVRDPESEPRLTVSDANTERAIKMCSWLSDHVIRCYGCAGSSVGTEVLAGRIKAGDLKEPFKYSDVRRKNWKGLGRPEDVKAAISTLAEALWIRTDQSRRYRINPKIKGIKAA